MNPALFIAFLAGMFFEWLWARCAPALLLTALLLTAGCTGKPDNTALLAKQASATKHISAAKVQFASASTKLRDARVSHTRAAASHAEATRWVTLIVPAVESLLLRVPEDLKPEVEALKLKVASLSAEIEMTTGAMTETTTGLTAATLAQSRGTAELEAGNSDINEINTNLGPAYFDDVNKIVKDNDAKTSRLNKLAGWGGLILASFAAYGASRHVKISVPATWATPGIVFGVVYAATFLIGRFWL